MPIKGQFTPQDLDRADLIINYIRQHYNEDLSLEDIQLEAGTSHKICQRLVKERTGGISIHQYHKLYRLQEALKDVSDTDKYDMTITEIAKRHGYNTAKYFIKVFREAYGITPQEYRANTLELLNAIVVK